MWRRVGGVSGHLNPGGQQFRDDDGTADPQVTAALAAYYVTRVKVWAVIAHLNAYINLFNLIPIWQLDGSRGPRALSCRRLTRFARRRLGRR